VSLNRLQTPKTLANSEGRH